MAKSKPFSPTIRQKLLIELQGLETDACNLGMFETARHINEATRKGGWEIERLLSKSKDGSKS